VSRKAASTLAVIDLNGIFSDTSLVKNVFISIRIFIHLRRLAKKFDTSLNHQSQ